MEKDKLRWSNSNFDVEYLSVDHLATISCGLQFIANDLEFDCDFEVFEEGGRINIQATKR